MTVHEVVPRGKHLLHRIGDWTLHTHLKMEGEWHVYRARRALAPARRSRRARSSATPSGTRWASTSPTSRSSRPRDEEQLVGHLGPDPLGENWDPAEAARRLGADERPVHVALLDQRNVAGFGNEYANEILFVRGILPTKPATETDAAAIVDLGARMIRANRDRAGRTFTGDDRPGRSTWVYRREGRPCRRCGTLIREGSLGADPTRERNTFWCPTCQT